MDDVEIIDLTEFWAGWAEVLLYGIYTTLFFRTLPISFGRSRSRRAVHWFAWATVVLYMFATIHNVLGVYRLLKGYVWLLGEPEAAIYFAEFDRWENSTFLAISYTTLWLGDMILIYRCFIVWGRNWYVVSVSIIIFVASVAICIPIFHYWTHSVGGVRFTGLKAVFSSIYPMAFVQNVLTTGLICYRLFRTGRNSSSAGIRPSSTRLHMYDIARIIMESAALRTIQLIAVMILYFLDVSAMFIIMHLTPPIVGIAYSLLAIRLHIASTDAQQARSSLYIPPSFARPSTVSPTAEDPPQAEDEHEVPKTTATAIPSTSSALSTTRR